LEDAFAQFEGPASEALVRIEQSSSISNKEDRELVLNLVALLAARNPRNRETFGKVQKDVIRGMAEMMVSTEERWDAMDKQALEANPKGNDIPYEQMREFVLGGEFDIELDQTHQIGLELGLIEPLLETLVKRKWTLRIAEDGAGDFVTSDHPVVLMPVGWNPGIYGVGFGLANTVVIFPLNRRMLLTGTFEGKDRVLSVGPVDVATHNRYVIMAAQRQVYAYNDAFQYFVPPFLFQSAHDLMVDPTFVGG
jgi:hypothetical protein